MARRGFRLVRPVAILAVVCAMVALVGADLLWRWRTASPKELIQPWGRETGADDARMAVSSGDDLRGTRSLPRFPAVADDPRMVPLRRAARSWGRSAGPRRLVVDQVCLVPDVPSFFEAIAAWDDRHFFPILIDEPAWTLPFLRAFRPARVVRHAARGDARAGSAARPAGSRSSADRLALWQAALLAVSRGWAPASRPEEELSPGGAPPRDLGPTPPGLVLSSPDSPMLAGAVALAAGRFQPLVRLEPTLSATESDRSGWAPPVRYGDILTLPQAWRFARYVEARVSTVAPRYDQLGDDCDFLTIAGDWPYRYDDRAEAGPARGIQCLDDLIGRVLVGGPGAEGLDDSRRRWAFAGRLMGDPAASVARAMAALFLAPDNALLWDTYERGPSHAEYTAGPSVNLLARAGLVRRAVVHAAGRGANLAGWHRIMEPSNRFGLIWINSTGERADFSIVGGPGRPADVPGGCPAAVVMIHSHSAEDPADPRTIAGRWLLQGAFVYFGSVNEPYLAAFRKPGLVADLAAEGVPLSAALRQGESEPLGRPWRLIFLGDPLYRLPAAHPARGRSTAGVNRQPSEIEDQSTKGEERRRLDPEAWSERSPAHAGWPVVEVAVASGSPSPGGAESSADRWLEWCRDAAIVELVGKGPADWRSALRRIRRDQLDPRLRPAYDELLIDALSQAGEWDELHARLSRIPPAECRPRVWAALETAAVFRLARAVRDPDRERGRARAEEIQDEVRRLAWPHGWGFPAQFAARVAAMPAQLSRDRQGAGVPRRP